MRFVLLDETLLLEEGVEDAVDRVRRPQRLLEPCTPALRRDDGELARPDLGEAALVENERDAGREERLADDQPPSSSDLDDDAVRQLDA